MVAKICGEGSQSLRSLYYLEPHMLADAIETAVEQAEPRIGKIIPRLSPRQPFWKKQSQLDLEKLAKTVRREINSGPSGFFW